jgi:L-ribulose-5-phosphate 4-epimerase
MSLKELKREAYEATLLILKNHLAVRSWGNVSAFDKASGLFSIRPYGVAYRDLKAKDMLVIDLQGRIIEGTRVPGDARTHAVLYNNIENIGGICHTHSPYATAWAQAKRAIPVYGTTHAAFLPCDVPLADEIEKNSEQKKDRDYETEIGEAIVKLFSDSEIIINSVAFGNFMNETAVVKTESSLKPFEIPMVLTVSHGPFTWGKNAAEAVDNSAVLEEIARLAYLTENINGKVPRLDETLHKHHYERRRRERGENL